MKRIIALLTAVIIFTAIDAPFVFSANSGYVATDNTYEQRADSYATREEAVAEFIKAVGIKSSSQSGEPLKRFSDYGKIAGIYTNAISAAVERGMVSGYEDGSFRPQRPITRIEALVILNRTLSDRTLSRSVSLSFDDTPGWAKDDIDRLAGAGIVEGYGDGTLGAGDLLTREQAAILAERAARMSGPAGNYYEYINEEWLKKTMIPSGERTWSNINGISRVRMKEIGEIVYSLYRMKYKEQKEFEKGSSEQKIADVFASAGNTAYRDTLGREPVQKYLDMIDGADSMYSVLSVMAELEKNGFHGLLSLTVGMDMYDSSKYVPVFSDCYMGMDPAAVNGGRWEETVAAYKKYLEKLFVMYGTGSVPASEKAAAVTNMCRSFAEASVQGSGSRPLPGGYKIYENDERRRVFNKLDTDKFLQHLDFPTDSKIFIYDLPLAERVNNVWKAENMELIKDYLRASVMDSSAVYLDSDVFAIYRDYQDELLGESSGAMPADFAVSMVEDLLGWDLAKLYVKQYASAEDKEAVEKLTRMILEAYKKQLESNTWMSAEGKQTAVKKIENLRIRVGYPENIDEYSDPEYEIRSIREGGNLLEYRCNYFMRYLTVAAEKVKSGAEVSYDTWAMLPQTVNAMYEPSTNSITIPSGILYAPIYDRSASLETNLGGIGTVIAHEISHALDSVGSRFDEKGNLRNWWQEQDEAKFADICGRVEEAYNKIEVLPGYYINGRRTLGENLADIAGMECILSIAGENNPRLGDLFKSYAVIWRTKADSEYIKMQLASDNHAPDSVRVNRVLSNFDEFERFYDIQPGDGMYLSEDEKIKIWS